MPNRTVLFGIGASMLTLLLACSSSQPITPNSPELDLAGGVERSDCKAYRPSSSANLTKSTSFQSDVVPVFATHCTGTNGCHALLSGTRAYLGADSAATYRAIVEVPSTQHPDMPLVTPGDPARSYLLHKMDGDQCLYDEKCGGFCQGSMPSSAPLLPSSDRLAIRRWILQGAKEN